MKSFNMKWNKHRLLVISFCTLSLNVCIFNIYQVTFNTYFYYLLIYFEIRSSFILEALAALATPKRMSHAERHSLEGKLAMVLEVCNVTICKNAMVQLDYIYSDIFYFVYRLRFTTSAVFDSS